MEQAKTAFLKAFQDRKFFFQCSNLTGLDELCREGRLVAYSGFDCTAPSLHIGNMVQIMTLRLMQKHGIKPIVLLGGGTTKVGDPSGRDETRKLRTDEDIEANKQGIKKVFSKFLTFGSNPTDAIIVDNADWLLGLNYIDFLRDVGSHFSVNRMLGFDSVKLRLEREHHLSFIEFNYMILQAYDFVELHKRYHCRLQVGGSDQWGNIINGIDLARRLGHEDELFALTTPLITTSSGAKMGKTAAGAVWLDPEMTSPYDFWQYWRNTEDADVGLFLRLFTDLPLSEITQLEALKDKEINEAKKILATEVTSLCHTRDVAEHAQMTAQITFEQGGAGEDLPQVDIPEAELRQGISIIHLLRISELVPSGGEAKRLIRGGGAKLNDQTITDEGMLVTADNLNREGKMKLSSGKKKHVMICVK